YWWWQCSPDKAEKPPGCVELHDGHVARHDQPPARCGHSARLGCIRTVRFHLMSAFDPKRTFGCILLGLGLSNFTSRIDPSSASRGGATQCNPLRQFFFV